MLDASFTSVYGDMNINIQTKKNRMEKIEWKRKFVVISTYFYRDNA
jgi:hypothetical protein